MKNPLDRPAMLLAMFTVFTARLKQRDCGYPNSKCPAGPVPETRLRLWIHRLSRTAKSVLDAMSRPYLFGQRVQPRQQSWHSPNTLNTIADELNTERRYPSLIRNAPTKQEQGESCSASSSIRGYTSGCGETLS